MLQKGLECRDGAVSGQGAAKMPLCLCLNVGGQRGGQSRVMWLKYDKNQRLVVLAANRTALARISLKFKISIKCRPTIPGYHSFSYIPADSGKTWGTTSQLVPETTWVPTAGLQAVFWHADALILWVIVVFWWFCIHSCGTFLLTRGYFWQLADCAGLVSRYAHLIHLCFCLKHFRQLKAALGCFKPSIWAKAWLLIAVARVAIRDELNSAELADSPKLWIFGDSVDRADSNLGKWA